MPVYIEYTYNYYPDDDGLTHMREVWTERAARHMYQDATDGVVTLLTVKDMRRHLRNVAAAADWLDRMATGVVEFDLDEVDMLRMNCDD